MGLIQKNVKSFVTNLKHSAANIGYSATLQKNAAFVRKRIETARPGEDLELHHLMSAKEQPLPLPLQQQKHQRLQCQHQQPQQQKPQPLQNLLSQLQPPKNQNQLLKNLKLHKNNHPL